MAKNVLVIAASYFSGALNLDIKIVDIKESKKDILNLFIQIKSGVAISSGGNQPVFVDLSMTKCNPKRFFMGS